MKADPQRRPSHASDSASQEQPARIYSPEPPEDAEPVTDNGLNHQFSSIRIGLTSSHDGGVIQRNGDSSDDEGENERLRRMRAPSPERSARVLPPGQLTTHRRPPYDTVMTDVGEQRRYMGSALRPHGGRESEMTGLYSYMRSDGGAGFLGMVDQPMTRPEIVHRHVTSEHPAREGETPRDLRQRGRPRTQSNHPEERRRGQSFDRDASPQRDDSPEREGHFLAMLNRSALPADQTRRLADPATRNAYLADRDRREVRRDINMYDRIAGEGVSVTSADVPPEAVEALGFFAPPTSVADTRRALQRTHRASRAAHRQIGSTVRLRQNVTAHPGTFAGIHVRHQLAAGSQLRIEDHQNGFFRVSMQNGGGTHHSTGSPTRPLGPTDPIWIHEDLFHPSVLGLVNHGEEHR